MTQNLEKPNKFWRQTQKPWRQWQGKSNQPETGEVILWNAKYKWLYMKNFPTSVMNDNDECPFFICLEQVCEIT